MKKGFVCRATRLRGWPDVSAAATRPGREGGALEAKLSPSRPNDEEARDKEPAAEAATEDVKPWSGAPDSAEAGAAQGLAWREGSTGR
jgi:hypothetical protein